MATTLNLADLPGKTPVPANIHNTKEPIDTNNKWKVLIIDDEEDVHQVTHLVLSDFKFRDRGLELINGYSGEDAIKLLKENPDVAVILMDVVMESDDAGLKAVDHIRNILNNPYVRIILRTGQAGKAPEREVIERYNINDYKDKSELTSQRFHTSLVSALRAYNDIKQIEKLAQSNEALEKAVAQRTQELTLANQDLKDNKASLSQAQTIANIGSWSMDLVSTEISCSDQMYKILGLKKDEYNPMTLQDLFRYIPAKERFWVELAIRDAHKKGSFKIEHTIKYKNNLHYVRQEGLLLFDDDGHPYRLMCVMQDITEKHDTELKLLKMANAIEQISDAVIVIDFAGTIEYVNKAFCKMTGYSKEELIGEQDILKDNPDYHTFLKRLRQIIRTETVSSNISINRRKDGSRYYEERTITPLRDSDKKITDFIVSCTDVTERIQTEEKLQHIAQHDALTGLPNRSLFQDRIEQNIARSPWRERYVALIFIDLDGFKPVNDELGHDVGDKLLKVVADRLLDCLRDGDTAARLGGDEFAVILNDIACKEDVEIIARKIQHALSEPILIDQHELLISCSMGISLCPDDGRESKVLLKKADTAMYKVKSAGKNGFEFYSEP